MDDDPVESGFSIGTSALGTGAVTLLLSAPTECVGTGYSQGRYASFDCTNLLGFETIAMNQGQAWLFAGLAGAVVGGVVALYRRFAAGGPTGSDHHVP
ncbi:hypothetical protein [Serinicoccus sp. LYQ131]|uniref:hypothetical protein n=1 Tax=Serinicoccus sp. LYQ131 TaxID=3378797 RepID=UPI0038536F39